MIWKKFSEEQPNKDGWYHIIDGDITTSKVTTDDIDIQEYSELYKDFGVHLPYGGWESTYITIPPNLLWARIHYPPLPHLLNNKIVLKWEKDPTDELGIKKRYYKNIEPKE